MIERFATFPKVTVLLEKFTKLLEFAKEVKLPFSKIKFDLTTLAFTLPAATVGEFNTPTDAEPNVFKL